MKKALILVTLALVLISFVKGSQGVETDQATVRDLNQAVDARLEKRLQTLSSKSRLAKDSAVLTASLLY